MRKSELIAKLQAINGDPLIFLDLDGEHTDDISPMVLTVNKQFLANINSNVRTLPSAGDKVVLI